MAIRHAETVWNRERVFMGTLDVPAAPAALAGAPPAGMAADVVVTSPLARAAATASALFPGRRILRDPRLRERHMGEWEGRPKADVRAEHPEWFPGGHLDVRVTPPGGEPLDALLERVRQVLDGLPGGGAVVLVTHNGWIRAAQHLLGAADLDAFHADPAPHLQPRRLR